MRDFAFPFSCRGFRKAAATVVLALGLIAPAAARADLPFPHGPDTAIVILGFGLLPDGSMRPELVERLRAGYVEAFFSPASPIIVTGGNPQAGITEAQAMADWLIARGLPPDRIHLEDAATCTVENAEFAAVVMDDLGTRDAVLVTSDDHMPRALATFTAAGVAVTDTYTADDLLDLLVFGPMP